MTLHLESLPFFGRDFFLFVGVFLPPLGLPHIGGDVLRQNFCLSFDERSGVCAYAVG
jgi:hypothetical protein